MRFCFRLANERAGHVRPNLRLLEPRSSHLSLSPPSRRARIRLQDDGGRLMLRGVAVCLRVRACVRARARARACVLCEAPGRWTGRVAKSCVFVTAADSL